jgi:pheromone shutdown-related protein TraB
MTQLQDPPAELQLTTIERDGRTIHLLGTAHISERSVAEVRQAIDELNPDTVCVELDQHRHDALTDESRWRNLDIFQVIRQRKVPMLLANLMLGAYQARLGDRLGVKPGAEMLAAVRAAEEAGAELVLADRDIQITLKRTWRNLSFWTKLKLFFSLGMGLFDTEELTEESLEQLRRGETLDDMLRELAEAFPQVKVPLIDERDAYLAASVAAAPGDVVLAVVGAAHVSGMRAHLEAGHGDERAALDELPPPGKVLRTLKWAVPVIVLAAFSVGYYRHAGEGLKDMLVAWVLPNAILASVLSLVAGSRLLSALTAFVASPITSLNPTIVAGIPVGLVEAWLRKPTVEDCERVREDSKTLRGLYRNRFTRVLLVFVGATVGSALGGYAGLTWLIALLGS